MNTTYNIDPQWILDRPRQIQRRRIVAAVLSILILSASILLGKWFAVVALVLGGAFWYVELRLVKNQYDELYVKVLEEGLFRSAPGRSENKPITLLTPWSDLAIDGITRKAGGVDVIRLIDKSLPKGVRAIKIDNFERMDELFHEIRSRTQQGGA